MVGAHTPISSNATTGINVGDSAPDFQLKNLAGETVSLSSFRGKPILLNFWVTWCPHCRAERPLIQEAYDTWREKGLVVLTVDLIGVGNNETALNLTNFMNANNYSFPVLLDVDGQVRKQYDITATPTNFLIDKNGIIREKMVGEFASKSEMEISLNSLFP
ncbi:MAG: TlpA disulfide reductase family protein [Chloroflexota bacterium]